MNNKPSTITVLISRAVAAYELSYRIDQIGDQVAYCADLVMIDLNALHSDLPVQWVAATAKLTNSLRSAFDSPRIDKLRTAPVDLFSTDRCFINRAELT